jgi:hypothetical protein
LLAAAGIVVLALAAIGVAWYYWTRVELQSRSASVPAVPLTSDMGATAEPTPALVSTTPAPVSAKPTSGAQTTRPVKAGERAEGRQADARPAVSSRTAPSPPVAASRVVPAPSAQKADSDDVLLIPVPKAGESPVFSAADEGVTPPVLMSPKLKTPLQHNEGAENLSTVDLVISDAGNVESVKLASPVRDYREAMMLSAVKAWRFKPASIEGLPVRYQLRIQISVTSVAAGNR